MSYESVGGVAPISSNLFSHCGDEVRVRDNITPNKTIIQTIENMKRKPRNPVPAASAAPTAANAIVYLK